METCDFNYCERYRNVDDLLDRYSSLRNTCVQTAGRSASELMISLWDRYITADDSCVCRFGKDQRSGIHRCASCTILSRLMRRLEVGRPFLIETGSRAGLSLTVENRGRRSPRMCLDRRARSLCCHLISHSLAEFDFLRCDPISNGILLEWIVGSISPSQGGQLSVFSCNRDVYALTETRQSLQGALKDSQQASLCLLQICCLFRSLEPYDFTAEEPSLERLYAVEKPYRFSFGGREFSSIWRFGLRLGSFSSVTTGKTRLFCSPCEVSFGCIPDFAISMIETWNLPGETYRLFRLKRGGIPALIRYRRAGVPIFPCGLDLYCIILQCWIDRRFRAIVDEERFLRSIWPGQRDLETLTFRCRDWRARNAERDSPSFRECLDLLEGLWLLENVIGIAEKAVDTLAAPLEQQEDIPLIDERSQERIMASPVSDPS